MRLYTGNRDHYWAHIITLPLHTIVIIHKRTLLLILGLVMVVIKSNEIPHYDYSYWKLVVFVYH